MGASSIDRELATLAAAQHGIFTRAQAIEVGASSSLLSRRVARGQWRWEARNVLAVEGAPPSWKRRVLTACFVCSGPASHRTGAALLGLRGFPMGLVEITVPRGRRFRPEGVIVHESLDLDRTESVTIDGIPTTPLDRTVLDLGAVMRFDDYDLAVQRFVADGRLTWQQLLDVLVRHARRGRNGVGRLRAVLDERYGVTPADSDFEVLVERLLLRAGLPAPVRQHEAVDERGATVARIDLAYPAARLAIELDGRAFHSDAASFERDRTRQNRLVLLGWTVLRFTWRQLLERPTHIVAEVRRALEIP